MWFGETVQAAVHMLLIFYIETVLYRPGQFIIVCPVRISPCQFFIGICLQKTVPD